MHDQYSPIDITILSHDNNIHNAGTARNHHTNAENYSSAQILLAIDNQMVREGVRDAFHQAGFNSCTETFNQESFQKAIEDTAFDLIVMSAEISGFLVTPVIAEMRNFRTKHHPFPVVILLLPKSQHDYIQHAVNCGPDDILLMPVALGPVIARAKNFAVHRRPFVVTVDYTGPDRHPNTVAGKEQIPLVEVPNPLRASVRKVPFEVLQSEIDLTKIQLNALKLERYAVQLRWLADMMPVVLHGHESDGSRLSVCAKRLKHIGEDLPARVHGDVNSRVHRLLTHLGGSADVMMQGVFPLDLHGILTNCRALAEEIQALLNPSSRTPCPDIAS